MPRQSGATGFIDFDIVGDRQGVQAMLTRLDSALSPVGLSLFLYGPVGAFIKHRAAQRFSGQGDDVSGKWAPLKESTIEFRENQHFKSGPINKRTGELERYITQGTVKVTPVPGFGAAMTYPGDEPDNAHLVTKVKTAQSGKAHPLTRPRPVLGMNERDLAAIMTSLAFHVKGYRATGAKA